MVAMETSKLMVTSGIYIYFFNCFFFFARYHRSITGFLVVQEPTCMHAHEFRLLGASCIFFIFGVTFVHANLCMHILASTSQDGGNPFPVIRLPVVNSVTDSSRHTLRLPALHSQWSRQVHIIHRSIPGFLVVQEPTCTHAHECRLLGASCYKHFSPGRSPP